MAARKKNESLVHWLDNCPPFMCYVLSSKCGRKPNSDELAHKSGLPEKTFWRIANAITWRKVQAWKIDAFCEACKVNHVYLARHRTFVKNCLMTGLADRYLDHRQRKWFALKSAQWQMFKRSNLV